MAIILGNDYDGHNHDCTKSKPTARPTVVHILYT